MLKKSFLLIIFFAFFLRFIFLFFNPNYYNTEFYGKLPDEWVYFKDFQIHDSQEYKILGVNILKKHSFSWDSNPVTLRTPGYPLFIAFIFFIFGIRDFWVMFFQVILSSLSVCIIYLITKEIYDEKKALLSSFLLSIDPLSIFYSSVFMSETLFIFFFLLFLYFFFQKKYFLSSFIMSFSVLIRPISTFLFVIFSFFIKKPIRAIPFILISLIFPFLWSLRNYNHYKIPFLTSISGLNLLYYNASIFEAERKKKSIEEVREEFSKKLPDEKNPLRLSLFAQRIALKKIMEAPFYYSFLHLKMSIKFMFSTKFDDILMKVKGDRRARFELFKDVVRENLSFFYKLIIIILCCFEMFITFLTIYVSFLYIFWKRGYFEKLFFFTWFYFFILSGMLVDARFRFPLMIISYILFSSAVFDFYKRFNKNEV